MLSIAADAVSDFNLHLHKTDGYHLPFLNQYFDLSFTSTVLQHNTNEGMLAAIIKEICRVTGKDIYIFERIEKKIKGTDLCLGRPVNYYRDLFDHEGFDLKKTIFINIQISYFVCGVIRKLFNKTNRKEGEKGTKIANVLQTCLLPLTSKFDKVFKVKRDLAMLHFYRK